MPDVGPAAGGEALHHREGGLGVQLPSVGHVQHLLVEPDAAPALGRLRGVQEFGPQPGGAQGTLHVTEARIGPVVHDARARQEPLAAVGLKLAPQTDSLCQHRHVIRIGVAGVEIARGAVRGPVEVPGAELLQQGYVPPAAGQRPGRCRAHGPAADDDGVKVCCQSILRRVLVREGRAVPGESQARSRATTVSAGTATTVVMRTVSLATTRPVR